MGICTEQALCICFHKDKYMEDSKISVEKTKTVLAY